MQPRQRLREIPDSDRYFSITVREDDWHFRLPSFGHLAKMLGLMSAFQQGDGIEKLVELLDVSGYAIGVMWFARGYDLDAGKAPRSLDGDEWREYGDAVIDELQEAGWRLPDIMVATNAIIEKLAGAMQEMTEAEAEGNG